MRRKKVGGDIWLSEDQFVKQWTLHFHDVRKCTTNYRERVGIKDTELIGIPFCDMPDIAVDVADSSGAARTCKWVWTSSWCHDTIRLLTVRQRIASVHMWQTSLKCVR